MDPETTFAIVTAPKRNSLHWQPGTVTLREIAIWVADPARQKEAGNYLLGTLRPTTAVHDDGKQCTNLHRRKDAIVSRSVLTLDIDTAQLDFYDTVELTLPWAAVMHTTFQSTPDAPRFRLLIMLDREVAPDEYILVATAVMQRLGKDQFDPGSAQPERYMFLPSAQRREWYQSLVLDGPPLPVDELLADFEPDLATLPMPKPHRNKRDPFAIGGVIGAFNTTYEDWDLLIETYDLPYTRVAEDRYQLAGARSQAGMGPIPGTVGFVYSHHVNDPAYGQTCSAFDLVRLHRFGHLDEDQPPRTPVNKLPSQTAMLELATADPRTIAQMVGMDMDDDTFRAEEWKLRLRRGPRSGKILDEIRNWDLVRENDPVFELLRFNELTLSPEFARPPPWRETAGAVTSNDRWEIVHYIERTYGLRSSREYVNSIVDTQSSRNPTNPVRDWLTGLVWDRKPRVEECLPGVAETTDYTRLVARKVMVAAVARILDPGCKWDHTLVLYGPEGIGKSWWIERIARGYASTLGRIDNKDTLLVMQRSWIVMADESYSLGKADHEAQKEFLTRTHDVYRMPYERETLVHPRHCVIWSTTNDETFLRRQEGNRRFLTVHCSERVNFDAMTDEYVDQLWAEAVYLYRAGEPLYLNEPQSEVAVEEREWFVEEDTLAGVVQEYLDQLVPSDWWDRTLEARQRWLADRDPNFDPPGTLSIDRVCSTQIWVEALGRRKGDIRRADLLEITKVLKRLQGWTALEGRNRIPGYGPQLVFIREELL